MSVSASVSRVGEAASGMFGSVLARLIRYARSFYVNREWKKLAVFVVVLWVVGYLLFDLMALIILSSVLLISDITGLMTILGAIASTVTVGWVLQRARTGAKQRARVLELQHTPTPETAAEAVSLLDSPVPEVRARASYIIAEVCDTAPGKIVKQYPGDAAEIVDRLAPLINDSERDARVNAAAALSFFSRDYPEEVVEYLDVVLHSLRYPDTDIQRHSAFTAGNLGSHYPEHAKEIVDVVETLLTDKDPDVRANACVALSLIPHNRTAGLLEQMTDDPNPDVAEEASEWLATTRGQQPAPGKGAEAAEGSQHATRGRSNEFVTDPPDFDFSDVAGMECLKDELREQVIDPFGGSEVYEKYGVSSDSGILFHGPPGTGKTYLSKALAGELGVNYIGIDIGDVESKWIGEGVENIKRVFSEAQSNQPCLIFIDEIDALAADRSSDTQHEDKKKMVNQLLQEMSNITGNDDLLVIAATNTPGDIDDAMLRTGRFDSKIRIPKPDGAARIAIFQHHLTAPAEMIDGKEFKRMTRGFVASDIVAIAQRAARSAAGRERETGSEGVVRKEDIAQAVNEVTAEQGDLGEFIVHPPDLDFTDVVGMEGLKEQLRSKVIDPLTDPELHEQYGLGVEHGVLLYGLPGTGKTYLSKALAGELGVNFIQAKAGDLVSKWIGEGAQNVQKMFEEARSNQPCLIFIDEIDALATDRSHQQSKSERQMVNQFLDEMSQLNDDVDDVVVIGATNRLQEVDDALLRTGRFSEKIEVGLPDTEARIALFEAYLSAPTNDLNIREIGDVTEGFVASDMENIAERAARKAMRRAKDGGNAREVTQDDVAEAVAEVRTGRAASA